MSTPGRYPFALEGPSGTLHGVVHLPEEPGPRPAVVICHGFKGFMDWGFFPYLAELLAQRGFVAVRFNYSGTGMQPGDDLVTDLEAFRDATYRQDVEETLVVLDAVARGDLPGLPAGALESRVDAHRLGLLGHSRGGGAAVLAAAEEAWRERLGALVTWAAVSRYDRFGDEAMAGWRETGEIEIVNGRTGQRLSLGPKVLDELDHRPETIDVLGGAARLRAPWLILHGGGDATVPADEARALDQAAAGPRELRVLPGASHTFDSAHPFPGPNPALIEAFNLTQTWFRRHLCS